MVFKPHGRHVEEHLNMATFYIPVSLMEMLKYRSNKLIKLSRFFVHPIDAAKKHRSYTQHGRLRPLGVTASLVL